MVPCSATVAKRSSENGTTGPWRWAVRLTIPSRNVHLTSLAVEACLKVRRPCAQTVGISSAQLALISGELKSLL